MVPRACQEEKDEPKRKTAESKGAPRNWFQGARSGEQKKNNETKTRRHERRVNGTPRNWFQGAQEAMSSKGPREPKR